MSRGRFNSYFLCREVEVILFAVSLFLFAVRFFFLPWVFFFLPLFFFSFCCEVLFFAVRLILLPWQLWATVRTWPIWALQMVTRASPKFNFTYFSHNYHNYAMFRDVPGCSGMFRDVPGCSMFRVLSTAFILRVRLEARLQICSKRNLGRFLFDQKFRKFWIGRRMELTFSGSSLIPKFCLNFRKIGIIPFHSTIPARV